MKKLLLAALFFMGLIQSNVALSGSDWSSLSTITSVRAFTDQEDQFILVSGFSNPHNCSNAGMLTVKKKDNNWRAVHTVIFSAFIAGRSVKFRVDGCANNGEFPIIDGVEVK